MKKWVLKAIVQKTISYLPGSNQINYFFQKYVTKGVYLNDTYFGDRLGHAHAHLEAYKHYVPGTGLPGTCLEIGTGWYPVVPISFFLAGTNRIYSVDITFLSSKERIFTTLQKFLEWKKNGALDPYLAPDPERWAQLEGVVQHYSDLTLDEVLEKLHLRYLITDARNLPLPDGSIDLVNSNNTFEHIYPDILLPILAECMRLARKNGGIQSHFIDMSDHFAHFDTSISIYNFLRFSDAQWRWIDNRIQPQNRLRIDDYRQMYAQLGLPISEETQRPGDLDALKKLRLAPAFAQKPLDVVAASHCHFISKM